MRIDGTRRLLRALLVLTAMAALGAITLPGFALAALGAESTATSQHEFAIIGMMTIGFVGLAWQSSRSGAGNATGLFWAALQRAGAVVFMGVGMAKGVFSDTAFVVMAFDAAAAAACIALMVELRRGRTK